MILLKILTQIMIQIPTLNPYKPRTLINGGPNENSQKREV
jgi:hypothetical protein